MLKFRLGTRLFSPGALTLALAMALHRLADFLEAAAAAKGDERASVADAVDRIRAAAVMLR